MRACVLVHHGRCACDCLQISALKSSETMFMSHCDELSKSFSLERSMMLLVMCIMNNR